MLKQESNRITFNYARQNYSDLILYNGEYGGYLGKKKALRRYVKAGK